MVEEDFGYGLPLPDLTNEEIAHALHEKKRSSKRYTLFSLLSTVAIPYAIQRYSRELPEPWDSAALSSMLLLEIVAVGTCLYSAYTWRKNSKELGELEQKL